MGKEQTSSGHTGAATWGHQRTNQGLAWLEAAAVFVRHLQQP
jgi:hypothetical protein